MLQPNNGFATMLANMYSQARPQFQAQQIQPPRMPNTGTMTEGYGPIGEAFGKGAGDFIQKAYVDPKIQAKSNEISMQTDPKTQFDQMKMAYDLYSKMPPETREMVKRQPGHQAKLQTWSAMFKGVAPITVDDTGAYTFAAPVTPIEQQKAGAVESMPQSQREPLLTGDLAKDVAQTRLFGAQAGSEGAQGDYYKVKTELAPKESEAENALRGAQTEYYKQKPESEADKLAAASDRQTKALLAQQDAQEKRLDAQAKRDAAQAELKERLATKAADEKEALANAKSQAKEWTESLSAFNSKVKQRQGKVAQGLSDPVSSALEDSTDLETHLNTTAHIERAFPQQVNLARGTILRLSEAYTKALADKKPDKVLDALKQRAYDLYDYFHYTDPKSGKP